jgi:hypothetical protein
MDTLEDILLKRNKKMMMIWIIIKKKKIEEVFLEIKDRKRKEKKKS